MSLLDLIRGDDGKLVLTKLQAATFHLIFALTVVAVTCARLYRYLLTGVEQPGGTLFDAGMWGLYAAVAVGHHWLDKTGAQVAAYKDKKLEANMPSGTVTETKTTIVKETP